MSATLLEIGDRIRSGQESAQEVTAAYLDRVAQRDPELNCYISVERDSALAQARRADEDLARGRDRGPLHGVPVAIKDIFERAGRRVTAGSAPFAYRAHRTATVVERLLAAGAVILGALNLDEFAAGGTGGNRHFGRCANPWNTDHETGGSSGGSAAAAAAGLAPATLGSDAGGSIRIPAAYCGVCGVKPTYGRVSRHGAVPRTWSMDCIGPLAPTAEDCAVLLSAIAGSDPADPTTRPDQAALSGRLRPPARGVRIGVAEAAFAGLPASMRDALGVTSNALDELGAEIVALPLPGFERLNDMQQVIVKCEAAAMHGRKLRQRPGDLSPEVIGVIQEGFVIPATAYIQALSLRAPLLRDFEVAVFGRCDALLMPATPTTAPRHAQDGSGADIDRRFSESARFTRFANYLGIPAVSFPCGLDETGMPVGLQLAGPPWSEQRLLGIVHALQTAGRVSAQRLRPISPPRAP